MWNPPYPPAPRPRATALFRCDSPGTRFPRTGPPRRDAVAVRDRDAARRAHVRYRERSRARLARGWLTRAGRIGGRPRGTRAACSGTYGPKGVDPCVPERGIPQDSPHPAVDRRPPMRPTGVKEVVARRGVSEHSWGSVPSMGWRRGHGVAIGGVRLEVAVHRIDHHTRGDASLMG